MRRKYIMLSIFKKKEKEYLSFRKKNVKEGAIA